MAELLTQEQIEDRMYMGGIARAEASMANAEQRGSSYQNPYAKEIFRDYVMPIAAAIKADAESSNAMSRMAHVKLLLGLDTEAVAFLAIRQTLGVLLSPNPEGHNTLGYGIGRVINRELVLSQFEFQNPELYHTLSRDFSRRLSKSERHRMAVFKMQAAAAGVKITEWPVGAYNQVGLYLMGLMETAGLISIDTTEIRVEYKRKQRPVFISPDVVERIDQIRSYVSITAPVYGPCVVPPKDWGQGIRGGFHTPRMAIRNGLVHAAYGAARDLSREADMPIVYQAVNGLQRTAWKVNSKMLDTVLDVAKVFHTKEIVSLADTPKPASPSWLSKDMKKENFTEQQMVEFLGWKRRVTDWHTERKILGSRYGRFYAATRAAEFFRDYPSIYFVYFADSRGRLYPMTQGISPQGSDLSKSLLHFAKGHPIREPEQILWFHVQGANKWGFDKATLHDRQKWVFENEDLIRSYARAPLDNVGWKDAGDPLQFLAWCFEYEDWKTNPNFVSHLPISMDGSCNGLQNLSAMFRDSIGGKATNLTNNQVMEDIYNSVAKAAERRLEALVFTEPAQIKAQEMWLVHGINRKAVKRAVMTTPYGVTLRTATEYIIDDYLREGLGPTFDKAEYRVAATVLMKAVWPAIGDVVVKGREAMDWLKKSSRQIVKAFPKDAEPVITWRTPSGFPASQAYFEHAVHKINTHLHGLVRIKVLSETDTPDAAAHASGLAPNFVHSMDAAHLHLTTSEAVREGIEDLAMIHDDYGCHAAFAPKLYEAIRRQFVAMYLGFDAVAALCEDYPGLSAPPEKGGLDIMEVLESQYFFS